MFKANDKQQVRRSKFFMSKINQQLFSISFLQKIVSKVKKILVQLSNGKFLYHKCPEN